MMADPFASAVGAHVLHRSLSTYDKLPIDFYEPLVGDFLQDERYVKWSVGCRPWQLHCYGGPGCGKTTFAACVANDLRHRYHDTGVFVAYVHIKEHVSDHHASFVEDFLFCLYSQVCTQPAYDYEKARRSGQSSSLRTQYLRNALYERLTENEHNFLIFDGYDTLDLATCLLLDHELKNPRLANLSLLVTRRNPPYRRPERYNVSCDGCGRHRLTLYWECQICGNAGPQYCYDCKEADIACTNNEHKLGLSEPYDRIDLDINKTYSRGPQSSMMGFIMRELETYTGLDRNAINELAWSISEKVGGNINLAKLRLDDLLSIDNLADTKKLGDRLPRSVIAFFDAEIEQISQRNLVDRDLGLIAIAAVAQSRDPKGIKVIDLERAMRNERNTSPHLARQATRSLEDILTAANGLLVLQPYEDVHYVACFNNQMFVSYVREDYNDTLYFAKSKLGSVEEVAPHATNNSWNMAPTTTSPPTMVDVSDSIDYVNARSTSQDSAYFSRSSSMNTAQSSYPGVGVSEPKGLFEHIGTLPPQSSVGQESNAMPNVKDSSITLCAFCQEQIFESDVSSGDHHKSDEAMFESWTSGCMLCTDLYQELFKPRVDPRQLQSLGPQEGHYRWTTRSTGRSHNVNSVFTITFTPQYDKQNVSQSTLPTKKYHVISETDLGHIPAKEALVSSTDPNQPGGGLQIREWMKVCAETHPHCNQHHGDAAFVPTRLVDLEAGDASMVRIADSKANDIKGPYLTLSHSWGPPTFLQLKKENESILMGPGVKIDELTINFQQAISVARFLGLRYIWIDSLCIMQGAGGDFLTEGQLMHKVYRFSHCNIAIADSVDSKGGLFRYHRKPSAILPAIIDADGNGKLESGRWRVLRDDLWNTDLLGTKIYTRGWVFQERMLAPRILHFAASQIFWDCSTLSACEALPTGLPHSLDANASTDRHWRGRMQLTSSSESQQPLVGANDDSIETFWRSALLNYTSCNLTSQGDKSVAIWSIAKLVRDALGEKYGAGLWENKLEEQLTWHVRDVAPQDSGRIPELQYRYPSWTWASIMGPVIAHGRLPKARQYVVTDHDEEAVAFESHFDDENQEPKLERKPMPMLGYVAQCTLSPKAGPHSPGFHLVGLEQQDSSGTFDVFLDEALPSVLNSEPAAPYPFIVLAASASSTHGSQSHAPSQLPISRGSTRPSVHSNTSHAPLDSIPELTPNTYSGIALLLTPAISYKARQDAVFQALLREVVERSPDRSWPDPPYGQGKSLVDRTTDMRMLVATLHAAMHYVKEKGGGDALYRRIGAIEFRDVDEGVWRCITREGKRKIWLD